MRLGAFQNSPQLAVNGEPMGHKTFSLSKICALALMFAMTTFASLRAAAQTETILHTFNGSGDGGEPYGAPIFDKAGNLYGVTFDGGTFTNGTVYELKAGSWTEEILHNFDLSAGDGQSPQGSLVMDSAGNLYGVTPLGGGRKLGIVYELTPQTGGTWKEKIIHTFVGGSDGRSPQAGLIIDKKGNLYGTTYQGGSGKNCGAFACGTVFELSRKTGGGWTEIILCSFNGGTSDGQNPSAPLLMDSAGNLYGTTLLGGTGGTIGAGTVFKLSPNGSGGYTETVLHNFICSVTDGCNPFAGLVLDSKGNLYSTTNAGGANGFGTVYEMSPGSNGKWTETVLHSFGAAGDGLYPQFSGVTFDKSGNLYGTASGGGSNSYGVVFKMTPASGSGWDESVFFNFDQTDGNVPQGVIFGANGNLYGITQYGGSNFGGTAFEIVP
jgi:uncharacterized repeat protein (TIGR03803 family)